MESKNTSAVEWFAGKMVGFVDPIFIFKSKQNVNFSFLEISKNETIFHYVFIEARFC